MSFGEEWGWGSNLEESKKVFDQFAEAGGNFIDTANYYTAGTSERMLGDFLKADRHHFVLATKYTLGMRKGDPNFGGNHRKNLMHSIDESLKRLQTDYIDLLWLHAWDFTTPIDEVMRALDDVVRSGRVHHIGISDAPAWVVSTANTLAELRGWSRFVALQIEYSLVQRTPERDLLPMADAFGLTVTPWSPLGGGILTGKYATNHKNTPGMRLKEGSVRLVDRNLTIAEAVKDTAKALGASPAQVALAWIRHKQPGHIPILGVSKAAQLQDNLASLAVTIPPENMRFLNEASKIELGFPHDFLASDNVRDIVFGGTYPQIDFK
jgi:aryl-alcohol dehydrogenase-like predicted oxidoreductase